MRSGELRSQADPLWNACCSGGIANPIEVIAQLTQLMFQRRLDDLHTLEVNKPLRGGKPTERRSYPPGADPRGRDHQDPRWSRFKNFAPAGMVTVVAEHVFVVSVARTLERLGGLWAAGGGHERQAHTP